MSIEINSNQIAGAGNPAGNDNEIQYKNGSNFGASTNLKFDNNLLIGGGAAGTSAASVISLKIGTVPTTSPADVTQLFTQAAGSAGASGGTKTVIGNDTTHTFTTSGVFTPGRDGDIEILLIAGGGGGGNNGGGGGGGGLVTKTITIDGSPLTVTIGGGGAGGTPAGYPYPKGTTGGSTLLGTETANGGGYGGGANDNGGGGGSGGGGGWGILNTTGGTATQGSAGGNGSSGSTAGGGGGGNTAVGGNNSGTTGGAGGAGTSSAISGSTVYYSGGGGGGASTTGGTAGNGGGGAGGSTGAASAGSANTGGGGGGGGTGGKVGADGGSGIVIIRYLTSSQIGLSELCVRDEIGNVTVLSPHNFDNIPKDVKVQVLKDSKNLAWTFSSKKGKNSINVDMFNAIRDLEVLTGKKYIYIKEHL